MTGQAGIRLQEKYDLFGENILDFKIKSGADLAGLKSSGVCPKILCREME